MPVSIIPLIIIGLALCAPLQASVHWGGCVNIGDLDRRIRACTSLIQQQGLSIDDLVTAYTRRGGAYTQKGQPDPAIADFTSALKYRPNSVETLDGRGWALNFKGEFALALRDLDQAIRLRPRYFYAYNNRGWAHNGLHQYGEAVADLTESIRLHPSFEYAYRNRSFAYRELGQLKEAITDISGLIQKYPDSTNYLNDRASIYILAQDFSSAIDDLQAALRLSTDQFERRAFERTIASVKKLQEQKDISPNRPSSPRQKKGSQNSPAGRRVALVIGNARYPGQALANPEYDAEAVAAALRKSGFSDVFLYENVDLNGMRDALKRFGQAALGAEGATVYYAGHGVEFGGVNYILPVDVSLQEPADIEREGVPVSELMQVVSSALTLRLVVLDACRNNPFFEQRGTFTNLRNGLGDFEPPSGLFVVYSVRQGRLASDGSPGRNSPFASAFVHYLEEPGLGLMQLFRKVRDSVLTDTAGNQEPFPYGWPPETSLRPGYKVRGAPNNSSPFVDCRATPVAEFRKHSGWEKVVWLSLPSRGWLTQRERCAPFVPV
jgi:tetratricopeptide (TPR) repeat protein